MNYDIWSFWILNLCFEYIRFAISSFISHFTNCTDTKYCFSKYFQHEVTKRSSVNATSSRLSVNQLVRMTWLLLLCFVNQFWTFKHFSNSQKLFRLCESLNWNFIDFYWFSGRPGVFSTPDPLSVLPHWRHLQSLRQRWQIVPRDIPETLQLPEQQQGRGHSRVSPHSPDVWVPAYHSDRHCQLPAPAESLVPEWDH